MQITADSSSKAEVPPSAQEKARSKSIRAEENAKKAEIRAAQAAAEVSSTEARAVGRFLSAKA